MSMKPKKNIEKTKSVNSKNKGSTFERKIANLLSGKFKEYLKIESGFRRNPDSGSFFGGTNQKRKDEYDLDYAVFGDLICPKNFLFSVECKHYKSAPTFNSIINCDVKMWDTWLDQAEQDCNNSNKKLMLIVKYNNVDEVVFVSEEIQHLQKCLFYKGKYVYKLSDILSLDENYFFELKS